LRRGEGEVITGPPVLLVPWRELFAGLGVEVVNQREVTFLIDRTGKSQPFGPLATPQTCYLLPLGVVVVAHQVLAEIFLRAVGIPCWIDPEHLLHKLLRAFLTTNGVHSGIHLQAEVLFRVEVENLPVHASPLSRA